jgi:Ca2+-binding RTX toxin-like protein
MTIFHFTPTNSAQTSGDHAFQSDSPGPDTLIVDANAYVRADGAGAIGALLHNTKAWTVKVNGLIDSDQSYGIGLDKNNTAVSTISVGTTGTVHGGTDAIVVLSASRLDNAGVIGGGSAGLSLGGAVAHTIRNTGEITGASYSIYDSAGQSTASVTNSGTLDGVVYLGNKADTLTNSGSILGAVETRGGNDRVVNSGNIGDRVELGDGDDRLTNSGNIADRVWCGDGDDIVTNSGNIGYSVSLGDGLNKLTNSGNIARDVFGGDDRDVVKNSGTIAGYVDLGGGNDSYTGGKYGDYVADSADSDSINLGAGNDTYYAHGDVNPADDGIDTIDGGAGYDVYDASTATDSVSINLDKIAHDLSPLNPGAMPVAAGTAFGAQVGADKIKNFEEAIGGSGHDVIYGSALANALEGGEGSDSLFGFGGNDVLIGGEGDDTLTGGTGMDLLYSGAGYDAFVFASLADSGTSTAARDAVMDFESGFDLIVLSPIDAISTNGPGDDTFNFIGGLSFSGVAGQLRAYATADGQIVEGDVNGDGTADFSIEVARNAFTNALTAGDFLL